MKKSRWFLLVFIFGVGLVSCSQPSSDTSNLYIPTPSDVSAAATIDELAQGRSLYIDNCNRCHGLYAPESFSSSRWRSIMSSMAPKTRMSSAEISLVLKYVTKGN